MGKGDISEVARKLGPDKIKTPFKKALEKSEEESKNGAEQAPDLSWLEPRLTSELTTIQPEQILRGILYKRCKMVLMGGSKSFKTWTLMDISYCVGNGLLWWGVHTEQHPVVYLDWELLDYDFRWRMERISTAYGKGSIDAVRRIGIRGRTLNSDCWTKMYEDIQSAGAGLVVADPTYKLLGPNRAENAAEDIAQVTAIFDRLSEETGASVIYAQHFSKGNQAGKESIDRGAGSGVWARDADAIVTMTKHAKGDDYLTVEHTLRSFSRIDPFVVQWDCPLFKRAPELDPADLKQPGGRPAKYSVDDLLECLGDDDLSSTELCARFMKAKKASERTFYKILEAATKLGAIHKCELDQKWEKVSNP
jgi:hypothetical protein